MTRKKLCADVIFFSNVFHQKLIESVNVEPMDMEGQPYFSWAEEVHVWTPCPPQRECKPIQDRSLCWQLMYAEHLKLSSK
jgi:hypothetical protein